MLGNEFTRNVEEVGNATTNNTNSSESNNSNTTETKFSWKLNSYLEFVVTIIALVLL